MTGRLAPPPRPTTPTDPTLTLRPVPRKKAFPVRSFGPGAAIDASPAAFKNWNAYEVKAYWLGSVHNKVCFVLNAKYVQLLANLTFRKDGDRMAEFRVWLECRLQAVDITWERPETTYSKYRGVRDIDIASLGRAYIVVDGLDLEAYNE